MMWPGLSRFCCLLELVCLFGFSAFAQTSDDQIEQYAAQGQKALAAGQYDVAEKMYQKLLQLEPHTAEIYGNLGLIYFQERKFAEAVPTLRQALKLKPTLPAADTLLAMSLSELGEYREALPQLERSFRRLSDPNLKRMCGLHLERAYTGLQQHSKAVEVALEMDSLYPNDPEVLYHSGRIYGNYAYLTMEKLAKAAPNSSWRYQAMAEAHESQGNSIAIAEYREVLKQDPNRPGIHYRLGRALLARSQKTNSSEDAAQAMQEFQKELELDPTNANAAYEIGEAHRKAAEWDDAQRYFQRALEAYPDFDEAHVGIAVVLLSKGQPAEALDHLQKAIKIDPEDEVAWYRLAQADRKIGNTADEQKALAEFHRLHEKANEQNLVNAGTAPGEVTKQQLDANAQ